MPQDSVFLPVFCGWEINLKTKIGKKNKQTAKVIYFIYGNTCCFQFLFSEYGTVWGITQAPSTRVQTNFYTDEFCSWAARLHGSVQILLQWCLHGSVQSLDQPRHLIPGHNRGVWGTVYTDPDKSFHLAFTRDRRNWTNFWTAKCASLGPEKSRPTFWPARFHICTDSCNHPNRATFCSDSAVMAWTQIPQLV